MDPFLCTHLIYAFYGITNSGELKIRNPHLDLEENNGLGNLRKFNDLKLKNPSLKTLLSVGGWNEGSTNFSIVAADPLKREKFRNSAIDFLQRHNFNGLDIDWEYPNQRHKLENNDRENFIMWLKELKEGFKPYGLLLTAAVKAVGYGADKSYNITEMVKYLDFMNVMTYALNGVWSPGVGINAPLYAGPSDLTERAKQRNFDAIAKYWIQKAPRDKIVMGVPFYGRSFILANPNNHSLGAPHTGAGIGGPYTKQSGILGYNELCEKFLMEKSLWHLEWESNQMVPYAYNDQQWIGYDNKRSVALKVDYVNKENLGGIMIWTVELDDFRGVCSTTRFPLLTIINEGLFGKESKNLTIAKKIMFIKYILFTIFILLPLQSIKEVADDKKYIVCYHGSWSYYRNSKGQFDITTALDPALCTHLNYGFIGIDETGHLHIKDRNLDLSSNKGRGNLRIFNDLKLKNPQVKTLLSVGGSQSSRNFSTTAADPEKISTFVESALHYIKRYGFDGLDLDWEYPNQYHSIKNNNDRENLVTLLQHLKEGFEPYGYLLTAAIGPAEYSPQLSYNISEMVKYLDFINVMAYDLHGPWESEIGHNAPLYAGSLDTTERAKQHSFDGLAKYWLSQGTPRNKLVMGIPFYARSYTVKDSGNHSTGAPHIGRGIGGQYTKEAGILGYNEMCEMFNQEKYNWHFEWDSIQKVPFAYNNSQWISYDNETSIALKVDYVKNETLGGIMIWTIELDDFRGVCGSKLTFINERLAAVT
ncbi:probable chitinase 10 [Calliphora vicina]|uniref:probable chitinase 10 n=1 Tax=Calliphora vicina TaxID=7373 RepID=UPI00325B5FBF